MSNNMLVTGLKRALVVGGALIVGACDLAGLFGNDGGRVQIALAPESGGGLANIIADSAGALLDRDHGNGGVRGAWWFSTANVTLGSVMLRTENGELIELNSELPLTLDVVKIDEGRQVQLPDGFLPPGSYDQVVLVITSVQAVSTDGTLITIDPPGGGWTAIVPICTIDVVEGETVPVGIAFNVRSSFLQLGNWWSFQPRLRSMDNNCADDDDEEDDNEG